MLADALDALDVFPDYLRHRLQQSGGSLLQEALCGGRAEMRLLAFQVQRTTGATATWSVSAAFTRALFRVEAYRSTASWGAGFRI